MSNFGEKVKATIDRLAKLPVTNLRFVIEGEFDLLENELRPLANGVRASFFRELHQILDEAGHIQHVERDGEVRLIPTVDTVRKTYGRICEKKGLKATGAVSNPPEQAHRPITTPIAMKEPVAPLVTAPSLSRLGSKTPARPVAVPGATPQDKIEITWKWAEELERLENEPFNADWSEQDQLLLSFFKQEAIENFRDPESFFHELYNIYQGGYKKSVLMKLNSKLSFLSK